MQTVKIYDCDHRAYTLLHTYQGKTLLAAEDEIRFLVVENISILPKSSVWIWDKPVEFTNIIPALQFIHKAKEPPAATEKLPKGKTSIKVYDNKGGEVKI